MHKRNVKIAPSWTISSAISYDGEITNQLWHHPGEIHNMALSALIFFVCFSHKSKYGFNRSGEDFGNEIYLRKSDTSITLVLSYAQISGPQLSCFSIFTIFHFILFFIKSYVWGTRREAVIYKMYWNVMLSDVFLIGVFHWFVCDFWEFFRACVKHKARGTEPSYSRVSFMSSEKLIA